MPRSPLARVTLAAFAVAGSIGLAGCLGSTTVTSTPVSSAPAHSSDGFSTPDQGKRFVGVEFRLKNTGSKAYDDSPSNGTTLVDSKDQQADADLASISAGPDLGAEVRLAPGDQRVGWMTFQLPLGAKPHQVQFALDSGFANQTGQWTVD